MTAPTSPPPTDRFAYSAYAAERVRTLHSQIQEGTVTEADARSEIAGIVYASLVPLDSARRFLDDHYLNSHMNVMDLADRIRDMLVDKILTPGQNGFSIEMAVATSSSPTGWAAKFADGQFGARHAWRGLMRARRYNVPHDPQPTEAPDHDYEIPSVFDRVLIENAEDDAVFDPDNVERDTALDLCAEIVGRRDGLRYSGKISRAARALVLGFGLPEPERPETPEVRERLLDELRANPEAALGAMQAVLSGTVPEDDALTGIWSSFGVRHLSTLNCSSMREAIAFNLAYSTLSPVRPLSDADKKAMRSAISGHLPDEPKARRLSSKLITSYVAARAEIGSEFTSLEVPEPKDPAVLAEDQMRLERVAASVLSAYPNTKLGNSVPEAIAFLDNTRRLIEHGEMESVFAPSVPAA